MNRLIKLISILLFCVFTKTVHAQESNEYSKVSFSIRGKWFYLPGWENVSWRSYSYGGEFFIGKHHAIGIDGDGFETHRRWETGEDDNLVAMEVTKRTSVYADYKYIYTFNEFFSLYAQIYSRFLGKRMFFYDRPSNKYQYFDPIDPNTLLSKTEGTFTDFGLGIGGKWYFNGGNSGLDLNINMYRRFGDFTETYYSSETGQTDYQINESSKVFGYVRLSFFYHFLRFKKSNDPVNRLKTW